MNAACKLPVARASACGERCRPNLGYTTESLISEPPLPTGRSVRTDLGLPDCGVKARCARGLEGEISPVCRTVKPIVAVGAEEDLHVRDKILYRGGRGSSASALR